MQTCLSGIILLTCIFNSYGGNSRKTIETNMVEQFIVATTDYKFLRNNNRFQL